MKTNWRDFSIGMAAGVALSFILYFGWGLISPQRAEAVNDIAATTNVPVGIDENALIAANAERSSDNLLRPPPQLQPEPRVAPEPEPELLPPPVVPPQPRPEPVEEVPPDEDPGPDDSGGKPEDQVASRH